MSLDKLLMSKAHGEPGLQTFPLVLKFKKISRTIMQDGIVPVAHSHIDRYIFSQQGKPWFSVHLQRWKQKKGRKFISNFFCAKIDVRSALEAFLMCTFQPKGGKFSSLNLTNLNRHAASEMTIFVDTID